jgi:hypothetical protein
MAPQRTPSQFATERVQKRADYFGRLRAGAIL